MPIQVLMPALSPTMEKGNLAKWLKQEGDPVKPGDVIAEIETDKATMEVEAIDEGVLGKILVPEGTNDVAVNTPIATILEDGEDAAALKDGRPETAASQAAAAKPAAEPAKAGRAAGRRSRARRSSRSCPRPMCRPAPRWPPSRCARRCATPWRRRCAATAMCS